MRKIEVVKMGVRRGPASEAQELFIDHSEPRPIREKIPENPKYEGKGRPTVLIDWPTPLNRLMIIIFGHNK